MIAILLAPIMMFAHDLWIDDAKQLYYGHAGSVTSHGKDEAVLSDKIAWRQCLQSDQNKSTCDVLMIALKPRYYTKTPYGTKHESKEKFKQVISSKQVFSFAKRVYNAQNISAFHKGFEITPRQAFGDLREGDKLRLHISMDGQALKGAPVAYGERFVGVSDQEGNINVKIRHTGLQQIKATFEQKGDGIHADTLLYETHLNVRIAE